MSDSAHELDARLRPAEEPGEADPAVIARASVGDREAMTSLLKAYQPVLEAAVRSRLPIHHLPGVEPDDLRQEAALALIEIVRGYAPSVGPLGRYLQRSLRWRLANFLRSERRRCGRGRLPIPAPLSAKAPPAMLPLAKLRGVRLQSALRSLTPRQRAILYRQHWQDQNTREIARHLGITAQAVTALRRRAEECLREGLAEPERRGG